MYSTENRVAESPIHIKLLQSPDPIKIRILPNMNIFTNFLQHYIFQGYINVRDLYINLFCSY
jgi:hypothetical protein